MVLLTAGILLIGAGVIVYLNAPPPLMKNGHFSIQYGETLQAVAIRLKNENYINSSSFFKGISYLYMRKHVQAGKYRLYSGMTSHEIFRKLSSGNVIKRKVTIPEGFNLYSIADRLEREGITGSGNFLYYAFNRSFLSSISIDFPSAEGYLFPDTYILPQEMDPRDVISVLYRNMKKNLKAIPLPADIRDRAALHRVLILASLIEKEARVKAEQRTISSVFHNRLKRNMRMDCDPTVRYAVKKFSGRITYDDLDSDSPFNTYRRHGLPPTPICSPGLDAVKAALNPAGTSYLYFVARNDGSHYFSKTLREHNRAVAFYQKGEKNGFTDRQKRLK